MQYLNEERKKHVQGIISPNPVKELQKYCLTEKLPPISYTITNDIFDGSKNMTYGSKLVHELRVAKYLSCTPYRPSRYLEICAKVGSVEAIGSGKSFNSARKSAAFALKAKLDAYGPDLLKEINKPDEFDSPFENNYELDEQLGGGGFGIVVKATSKSTKMPLAIKRVKLPLKDKDREKIIRGDVECFARLTHPNIVRFYKHWFENPPIGWQKRFDLEHEYEDGHDDTQIYSDESDTEDDETETEKAKATIQTFVSYLYVEMELCSNGTLEKWLRDNLDDRSLALSFFKQLLDGVEHLHKNEIIHR